jgi:malonate transporter and related proteins
MDILTITLPIFLLIGLGYLVTWRGLFSADQVRGLGSSTWRCRP